MKALRKTRSKNNEKRKIKDIAEKPKKSCIDTADQLSLLVDPHIEQVARLIDFKVIHK